MNGFEYLSVFFSVVVGLAVTRIMAGIATLVEARHRVKTHWLQVLWIVNVLIMDIQVWWGMWPLKDFDHWNFRTFCLVVSLPGILYLMSDLVGPDAGDTTGEVDMAARYETVRSPFFSLLFLYAVCSMAANIVLFGTPMVSAMTAIPAVLGLGALACMRFGHRMLHAAFGILTLALYIVFITMDTQVIR